RLLGFSAPGQTLPERHDSLHAIVTTSCQRPTHLLLEGRSMRSFRFCVFAALFLTIVGSIPLAGQSRATTVSGRVVDSAGAPIVGVTLTVRGSRAGAVSDVAGRYELWNVDPGSHLLVARRIGYAVDSVTVVASAGSATTQDITLRPSPSRL